MIMTIAAALFGAFLGTVFTSRVWAVFAAATTAGFVHSTVVLTALTWIGAGGNPADTAMLLAVCGAEPVDLGASVASAGLATVFAGMLSARSGGGVARKLRDAAFERASIVDPGGQRVDVLLNR